jgi:hypothetical protein
MQIPTCIFRPPLSLLPVSRWFLEPDSMQSAPT